MDFIADVLSSLTFVTNVIRDLIFVVIELILKLLITVCHEGLMYLANKMLPLFKIDADILSTTHVVGKIISTYGSAFRVIGFSVLILIATWQIFKGFFSFMDLSTGPEEAWKIGIKCILFGILVLESKELCRLILKIFDAFMEGFNIDAALNFHMGEQFTSNINYVKNYFSRDLGTVIKSILVSEHALSIIVLVVQAYFLLLFDIKLIGIAIDFSEKYIKIAIFIMVAPLSFACGVAKATSQIFNAWIKAFTGLLASVAMKYALLALLTHMVNESMFAVASDLGGVIKNAIIMLAMISLVNASDNLVSELGFEPGKQTAGVSGMLAAPIKDQMDTAKSYAVNRSAYRSALKSSREGASLDD